METQNLIDCAVQKGLKHAEVDVGRLRSDLSQDGAVLRVPAGFVVYVNTLEFSPTATFVIDGRL